MAKTILTMCVIISLSTFTACNSSKGIDVSKLDESTYDNSKQSSDLSLEVEESTDDSSKQSPDISLEVKESTYDSSKQSSDVSLEVKEETVTTDTEDIVLIYTNRSRKQYNFSVEQELEMEVDGTWYIVPLVTPGGWNELSCILLPESTTEQPFYIKKYYDKIAAGKYRIIKHVHSSLTGDHRFTIAEFDVHETQPQSH